jgi:regulator of nonsense transcripts 2
MVENAYYSANPPDRPAITVKEREPLELYLRKLVHQDLTPQTAEKILEKIRKFPWDDPKTMYILQKTFYKIWKVKYSNVECMAWMIYELSRYYPHFGTFMVDAVLEEIRLGLESNLFKDNQRRVSVVKYLAELYNYRLIGMNLVFETLYLILRFGHGMFFERVGFMIREWHSETRCDFGPRCTI